MADIVINAFLFSLKKGIFFKGVISIGRFFHTKSLIVGPAIDEAAEFYRGPDWIGVSAAPSASLGLSRLEAQGAGNELSRWFIRYDIPTKNSIQKNEWALAWPKKFCNQQPNAENNLGARGELFHILATHPISNDAITKYKNTLDFFNFCEPLNKAH